RMMITAVPLLYGSYTVTRGLGTFRLEPPLSLNLAAGWPMFKASERNSIEQRYAEYQKKAAVAQGGPISIPGMSPSATPPPAANASNAQAPAVAQAPSVPTATPVPVLPAQPVPADASNVALASNAGGGSWKTFPAGRMPLGRLIGTGDLRDVAEHGLAGERIYFKGQFVGNF